MNLKSKGFTMAEILLSLTIIGVVAAITLPSLTGNINERTWHTQRKALFSRMSQAISLMPALNNYGSTVDNYTETFITAGLSKVLKINNICSTDKISDCGFPTSYVDALAEKHTTIPTNIQGLNPSLIGAVGATAVMIPNSKAAAFETANGESIVAYYNPKCTAADVVLPYNATTNYIKQQICLNLFFDLNGKKGPNTIGKDMGVISVAYPTDSRVVMPMYPKNMAGGLNWYESAQACSGIDDGSFRLPNMEELLSLYWNKQVTGNFENVLGWSATSVDRDYAYGMGFAIGVKYKWRKNTGSGNIDFVCVQR